MSRTRRVWKVLIIYSDGMLCHLQCGNGEPATFRTRRKAQEQADFMKVGMEGDPDVQSVNVVEERFAGKSA